MDADEIRKIIKEDEKEGKAFGKYNPEPKQFDNSIIGESGTVIKISGLKKNLTRATVNGYEKE